MPNLDLISDALSSKIATPITARTATRKQAQVNAFSSQKICILINDERHDIPRFRLTPEFVQGLVEKGSDGKRSRLEDMYLVSNGKGEAIIQPLRMQTDCRPPPASYKAVTKEASALQDARNDDCYKGKMKFVIRDLPTYSCNERYAVTEEDVKTWAATCVVREEQGEKALTTQISNLELSIKMVQDHINLLPSRPMFASNGSGVMLKGKKAAKERKRRLQSLLAEKQRTSSEIDAASEKLAKTIRRKCSIVKSRINVMRDSQKYEPVPSKRTSWTVEFTGADKQYYEELAQQADWKAVTMYAGDNGDESKNMDREQVDLGSATFARVEHGYGVFHDISNGTIYEGTYEDGHQSGQGIMYASNGVYSGNMLHGEPCGEGSMEYKDGDVLSGSFALVGKDNRRSTFDPNPYIRGQPHGKVKISFADGSFYDGEMDDGQITGSGTYINASGDRYEGCFEKGSLVKGKIQYASGEVAEGEFRGNMLHGFGTWRDAKREVSGFFDESLLHGKGTVTYRDSSRFQGFFRSGQRSRHGVMSTSMRSDGSPDSPLRKVIVEAPWMGGRLRSGGRITVVSAGKSWPSFDGASSSLPWLSQLQTNEDIDAENFARVRAEANEKDSIFRRQIREKKMQIYDTELQKRLAAIETEPSKEPDAVYFTHKKSLIRPTSITEASLRPGLRTEYGSLESPSNLRQTIKHKWKSIDLDKLKLR